MINGNAYLKDLMGKKVKKNINKNIKEITKQC